MGDGRDWQETTKSCKVSFGSDENGQKLIMVINVQLRDYTKIYWFIILNGWILWYIN